MSYRSLWATFFDDEDLETGFEEVAVRCVFHPYNNGREDDNPSLYINLENGLYDCKSCDPTGPRRPGGDAIWFVRSYFDVGYGAAAAYVEAALQGREPPLPIDPSEILLHWKALRASPKILDAIKSKRGLDDRLIDDAKIGWDGHRVTIPIANYRGDYVNVRRYDLSGKDKGAKMISRSPLALQGADGKIHELHYGERRLWPMRVLESPGPILIVAGEWDCLLASQMGQLAITSTGGEMSWVADWDHWFVGRDVAICYDMDKEGKQGAAFVAARLQAVAASVKVLRLPFARPDKANKDLTDWVVKHGATADDLAALIAATPIWEAPRQVTDRPLTSSAEPEGVTSLFDAINDPIYQGTRVAIEVQVAGKAASPYTIPRRATLSCTQMSASNPLCGGCAINLSGANAVDLDLAADRDRLQLIRTTDDSKLAAIRKLAGVPKCDLWTMSVSESQNVDELVVTTRAEAGYVNGLATDFSLQPTYYFHVTGQRPLEESQSYVLEAVRDADPWKQNTALVAYKAEPMQDTLQEFALTPASIERLRRFRPLPEQGPRERLAQVAAAMAAHVTRLVGRDDLLVAMLLSYTALQQFPFFGQVERNGLVELLVIGDSGTGKSETLMSLARWVKLGEIVTGEATSFAGLVGAPQQSSTGQWMITWGRIPLNNGRLLGIDEASGMPVEHFAKMSGLRSSRVAEITKVRQARTPARTRLIWLSNCRDARTLGSYSHGVDAVPALIGQPEDVRRFDWVLSAASGEVLPEAINALPEDRPTPPDLWFEADDLRALILWAWSRTAEQVRFTGAAERAALTAALEMSNVYSATIPLVEPSVQRLKIARLAASVAAATFSTDGDDAETVLVTEAHVRAARELMDAAYAKPSLDYLGYSQRNRTDDEVAEHEAEAIKAWLRIYREGDLADLLHRLDLFSARDLEEQLSLERQDVSMAIQKLTRAHMLVKAGPLYRKAATLNRILGELQKEESHGTPPLVPSP